LFKYGGQGQNLGSQERKRADYIILMLDIMVERYSATGKKACQTLKTWVIVRVHETLTTEP
jgi:hypothetical protein